MALSAVVTRDAQTAYIGLGSNLQGAWGTPPQTLRQAVAHLRQMPQTHITAVSPIYTSAPIDAGGDDYTNAVVQLQTRLTAPDLLIELQKIEQMAGRVRPYLNAPRTLDLDLIRYADAHIQSPQLTVPHPRMMERAFVLLPLCDIASHLVSAADLANVANQRLQCLG